MSNAKEGFLRYIGEVSVPVAEGKMGEKFYYDHFSRPKLGQRDAGSLFTSIIILVQSLLSNTLALNRRARWELRI